MKKSDRDLVSPIPNSVIQNQAGGTGQRVLYEIDGVLHHYAHVDRYDKAERLDQKLGAEIDWIERFTSHGPSVGTHYEEALSDVVRACLPSDTWVSSGFIFDSLRESCSPQIDILCYKDVNIAPLYRRKDRFVIVQPEAVVAACEVKKNLRKADLIAWIDKTIGCNMGSHSDMPHGIQKMSIFAYKSGVKTSALVEGIRNSISKFLEQFRATTKRGDVVYMAVMHMTLPQVYMRDREEFLSVSLCRDEGRPAFGEIVIETLKGGGPKGVGPYLGSLLSTGSQMRRDHISSYLNEIVEECRTGLRLAPISRLGSQELIDKYPDAKKMLQNNKAFAALYSSFESPSEYNSLSEFSQSPGFSWEFQPQAQSDSRN